ncbi:MAG: hypothetical protein NTZ78_15225 [Candidatus Aureabacteria bacterium]|nr:hypothetical protein [Candidatus Auribacterota bacterium]
MQQNNKTMPGLDDLTKQGNQLLKIQDTSSAKPSFDQWIKDVSTWLQEVAPNSGLFPEWIAVNMFESQFGGKHIDYMMGEVIWSSFRTKVKQRLEWLSKIPEKIQSPSRKEGSHNNELILPDKVTLSWLFRHVPCKFWWGLMGLFVAVFILGIKVGQTTFIREIMGYPISGGGINGQSRLSAQEQYAKLSESGKQLILEAFETQTVDLKKFSAAKSFKLPELRSQAVILASEYGWVTIKDSSITLTEKGHKEVSNFIGLVYARWK